MDTLRARTETVQIICDRIADGESLRRILATPDMPSMSTIRRWRIEDPETERSFLLAAQAQSDTFADMMLDVAVSAKGGTKEDIAAARLEIETLKWRAGQQSPKKWGINRQQVELSRSLDLRQVPDDELLAMLAKQQVEVDAILQRAGMKASATG
ncbi:MAG: hypothetical protein HQL90_07315 [Magnetococcales bacterium]|nr:hypothetical protein [Magnetococcales bacterium]